MPSPHDPDVIGPVQAFWRYKLVAVPVCLVLAAGAAAAAYSQGGTSEASTTIFLTDPRGIPLFRGLTTASADLANYTDQRAQFARSSAVLGEVAAITPGNETVDSLRDIVSTESEASGLIVRCRDDNAEHAREICVEVTEAYQRLSKAETLRRADIAIDALTQARELLVDADETSTTAIDQLDVKVADTLTTAALFESGVEFVEAVDVHTESRVAPAIQYGLAAFLFGLLLSGAIAWILAARRPRIRDARSASRSLDAPIVAHIRASGAAFDADTLATNLAAAGASGIIGFTSVTDSPAKSYAAAGLAEVWVREGRRVLLVDATLNGARLSTVLGVPSGGAGLTELLSGSAGPADVAVDVAVDSDLTMRYVPSGRPVGHEASLIRSTGARSVFDRLRQEFDFVIVDAAPMLESNAGSAVASVSDGLVVIVQRGTKSRDLDELKQRLDVMHTPILGVVFETGRR